MSIAITLAQYLLDEAAEYDIVSHPHTESASATAAASRVPADRVAKEVVLGGRDGFMLALLPASRHIQFDELRRLLGNEVDLATEEQLETLFVDCEPGSVPAPGAAYGLKVVVNDSLAQLSDMYFEAGYHCNLGPCQRDKFSEADGECEMGSPGSKHSSEQGLGQCATG